VCYPAWAWAGAIGEFADDSFDVVILDGLYRPECVRRGTSKVKPGGLGRAGAVLVAPGWFPSFPDAALDPC
jgi:hypothetical protein